MPTKFGDNKKRVPIAIYQYIRENDGNIWVDPSDIEPYTDGTLSRSFIQLTMQTLEAEGNLEGEKDRNARSVRFSLTAKGIGQAEKYAEELGVWEDFDQLRTSVNEVIDLDPAQTAAAKDALDKLSTALKTGNDVGGLSEEEVQSAISEVAALRQMLDAAKIRAGVLATQARQSLKWIGEHAAKAAVGDLAKKALSLILSLLGYGN